MHRWAAWAWQKIETKREKTLKLLVIYTGLQILHNYKSSWHVINKNSRFLTSTKILSTSLCFELFYASRYDGKFKLYDNIIKQESVRCSTLHWNKTNSVTPIIILLENLRASLCAFYASSSIFLYPIVAITLPFFHIFNFTVVSQQIKQILQMA